jgi:hypothetical protein
MQGAGRVGDPWLGRTEGRRERSLRAAHNQPEELRLATPNAVRPRDSLRPLAEQGRNWRRGPIGSEQR